MNTLKKISSLFNPVQSRNASYGGAPIWYLESPDVLQPQNDLFEIRGWIASESNLKNIYLADHRLNKEFSFTKIKRPDVEAVYHLPACGFSAHCKLEIVQDLDFIVLNFENSDGIFDIIVPVKSQAQSLEQRKKNKLSKLKPHLCCPMCGQSNFSEAVEKLRCVSCKSEFPINTNAYNFLTSELSRQFNIVPTSNVSANQYDGTALNFIHKHHSGLLLDCGAGLRDKYYENVVNFEIVPYDSTDVLGVGECLPFKDNTFDCVFSFAVLEHVKDPFTCAKEIMRVLKPGGDLYCQVPFLQPLHGYPHHYYNMTQLGLRNLFGEAIEKCEVGTQNFGQPIFFLSWALNSYRNALPPVVRERFEDLKVRDLLQPGSAYMGEDFVLELSEDGKNELSCCNYIIGKKYHN